MFTNRISKFFIVALVIVAALSTVSFATRSVILPAADRSYDSIESLRVASVQANRSYDAVEELRVARPSVSIVSGYDQIEALRVQRGAAFSTAFSYDAIEQVRIERAFNADGSYDDIEALRLWR